MPPPRTFHMQVGKSITRSAIFPSRVCKTSTRWTPARPDDALAQPTRARCSPCQRAPAPAGTDELAGRLRCTPTAYGTPRAPAQGGVGGRRAPARRGGGRGTCGRLQRTPDQAANRRAPTPTSVAGSPASSRRARPACARWRRPGGRSAATWRLRMARARPRRTCSPRSSRWDFSPSARSNVGTGHLPVVQLPVPRRRAGQRGDRCTLHRGMTRGLLDVISPKTKLAAFVPRDPYAAGCLIELRGSCADQAAARLGIVREEPGPQGARPQASSPRDPVLDLRGTGDRA